MNIDREDSEEKFKHITEMTILTVQLTVEFSKRLPGFDTLLREDQITLLKVAQQNIGFRIYIGLMTKQTSKYLLCLIEFARVFI